MPHLRIETNVPSSKVTDQHLQELGKIVAKTLGKPEGYCVVQIVGDQKMNWAGTSAPCATGHLMSIGSLGVAENKKHAAVIYPYVQQHFGIPPDRFYLTFINAAASDVGFNGSTFHGIL